MLHCTWRTNALFCGWLLTSWPFATQDLICCLAHCLEIYEISIHNQLWCLNFTVSCCSLPSPWRIISAIIGQPSIMDPIATTLHPQTALPVSHLLLNMATTVCTKTILIKIPQVYCSRWLLFSAGWGLKGLMPYPRPHKDDGHEWGAVMTRSKKTHCVFVIKDQFFASKVLMKIAICLYLIFINKFREGIEFCQTLLVESSPCLIHHNFYRSK